MSEPHEGDAARQGPVPDGQGTPQSRAGSQQPHPGGWGAGADEPPGYGQPSGGPRYASPTAGGPQYGGPQYGGPQHGSRTPGGPEYGSPTPGDPQYGSPPYGSPTAGGPQYGSPQYGGPAAGGPQYGAPQYGAPQGYRPAPVQRGIVPLRPLGLGEIFDGAFRSVRANPRVMFGFSALVVTVAVALGTLLQLLILPVIAESMTEVASDVDPRGELDLAGTLGVSLSQLVMLPWIGLATAVLTGLLTISVSRSVIGQTTSVGELWAGSWKHVLLVVAYTFAFSLVGLLVWGGWLAAVVAFGVQGSTAGALLVGLGGGLALLLLSIWVSIRLLFVPPVMVLERTGLRSIPRAWRLSGGSFWRVFGIYLLTSVVVTVISQLIVTPFAMVAMFMLQDPTMTSTASIVLTNLGTALASVVTIVFMAAVVALLYIDLRIRREGLDVELARAAEAAAAEAAAGGQAVGRTR